MKKWIIRLLIIVFSLLIGAALALFISHQYFKPQDNEVNVLSREGIVTKMQALSRLETMAYNVDTVVTSEKKGTWLALWQDAQKGLFVVHGQVIAGIDLDKLSTDNVTISEVDNSITINLPPVEVFKTSVDNIQVYDISGGFLNVQPTTKEMIDKLQIEAKRQIQISACKADILQNANDNAKKQITQLFALTGMQVTVNTQTTPKCH